MTQRYRGYGESNYTPRRFSSRSQGDFASRVRAAQAAADKRRIDQLAAPGLEESLAKMREQVQALSLPGEDPSVAITPTEVKAPWREDLLRFIGLTPNSAKWAMKATPSIFGDPDGDLAQQASRLGEQKPYSTNPASVTGRLVSRWFDISGGLSGMQQSVMSDPETRDAARQDLISRSSILGQRGYELLSKLGGEDEKIRAERDRANYARWKRGEISLTDLKNEALESQRQRPWWMQALNETVSPTGMVENVVGGKLIKPLGAGFRKVKGFIKGKPWKPGDDATTLAERKLLADDPDLTMDLVTEWTPMSVRGGVQAGQNQVNEVNKIVSVLGYIPNRIKRGMAKTFTPVAVGNPLDSMTPGVMLEFMAAKKPGAVNAMVDVVEVKLRRAGDIDDAFGIIQDGDDFIMNAPNIRTLRSEGKLVTGTFAELMEVVETTPGRNVSEMSDAMRKRYENYLGIKDDILGSLTSSQRDIVDAYSRLPQQLLQLASKNGVKVQTSAFDELGEPVIADILTLSDKTPFGYTPHVYKSTREAMELITPGRDAKAVISTEPKFYEMDRVYDSISEAVAAGENPKHPFFAMKVLTKGIYESIADNDIDRAIMPYAESALDRLKPLIFKQADDAVTNVVRFEEATKPLFDLSTALLGKSGVRGLLGTARQKLEKRVRFGPEQTDISEAYRMGEAIPAATPVDTPVDSIIKGKEKLFHASREGSDVSAQLTGRGGNEFGSGIYLTTDPTVAHRLAGTGGSVRNVNVNIKKVFDLDKPAERSMIKHLRQQWGGTEELANALRLSGVATIKDIKKNDTLYRVLSNLKEKTPAGKGRAPDYSWRVREIEAIRGVGEPELSAAAKSIRGIDNAKDTANALLASEGFEGITAVKTSLKGMTKDRVLVVFDDPTASGQLRKRAETGVSAGYVGQKGFQSRVMPAPYAGASRYELATKRRGDPINIEDIPEIKDSVRKVMRDVRLLSNATPAAIATIKLGLKEQDPVIARQYLGEGMSLIRQRADELRDTAKVLQDAKKEAIKEAKRVNQGELQIKLSTGQTRYLTPRQVIDDTLPPGTTNDYATQFGELTKESRANLTKSWNHTIAGETPTDVSQWMRALNNIGRVGEWLTVRNGIIRSLRSTYDFGAMNIHLIPMLWKHPEAYGQAVKIGVMSFWDPKVQQRFLEQHVTGLEDMAQSGHLGTAAVEFTEGISAVRSLFEEKIPSFVPESVGELSKFLGRTTGRFESVYTGMLLSAKVLAYEAIQPTTKRYADELMASGNKRDIIRKIGEREGLAKPGIDFANTAEGRKIAEQWVRTETGEHVAKLTGSLDLEGLGMSKSIRSTLSGFLFFAPKYRLSSYGMILDVTRGGVRGAEARKMVGNFLASGTLAYVAVGMRIGQEPNLDPTSGGFMTYTINGARVGIGGAYMAMARIAANLFKDVDEAQTGDESWLSVMDATDRDNWMQKMVRGQSAPLTGMTWDTLSRSTYMGEPLDTNGKIAKNLLRSGGVPFWADTFFESPGAGWTGAASEFGGFRTFPTSGWERAVLEINEAMAKPDPETGKVMFPNKYGHPIPYNELTDLQKTRARNAFPVIDAMMKESNELWGTRTEGIDKKISDYRIETNKVRLEHIAQLEELAQGFRSGDLSGGMYMDLRSNLMTQRSGKYNSLREEHAEAITEMTKTISDKLSDYTEDKKIDFVGDIAYMDYLLNITYNDNIEKDYGIYDYAEAERLTKAWINHWGPDIYKYVLTRQNVSYENMPNEKEIREGIHAFRPYFTAGEAILERLGESDKITKWKEFKEAKAMKERGVVLQRDYYDEYEWIRDVEKAETKIRQEMRRRNDVLERWMYKWGYLDSRDPSESLINEINKVSETGYLLTSEISTQDIIESVQVQQPVAQ